MTAMHTSDWGRIEPDGTVYVRTRAGERPVGEWHAGDPAAGLAYYERRYGALVTEAGLLERRLASGAGDPRDVLASTRRLLESLPSAAAVGDLDGLADRLAALAADATERAEQFGHDRAAAAERAVAAKEALAAEAEALAQSESWKATGDRFRALAQEWQALTGAGRLREADRRVEATQWRRVVAAREEFGRRRGAHFAALEQERGIARKRKEALVRTAEELAESTDWAPTADRLKGLMTEWKAAGRAAKPADDALWQRFRAASDAFFARRSALHAERDSALRDNVAVKEALVAEAEALDPADLTATQGRLRDIQDRWEAAGEVPREALAGLERRMATVERRLRERAQERWRPDPASSPLVTRLRESVAKLERRVERERAAGRVAAAAEAEATLTSQREWLAQAENVK